MSLLSLSLFLFLIHVISLSFYLFFLSHFSLYLPLSPLCHYLSFSFFLSLFSIQSLSFINLFLHPSFIILHSPPSLCHCLSFFLLSLSLSHYLSFSSPSFIVFLSFSLSCARRNRKGCTSGCVTFGVETSGRTTHGLLLRNKIKSQAYKVL